MALSFASGDEGGGGTSYAVASTTDVTISSGTGGASGDIVFSTNGSEAARFLFGAAGPPNTRGTLLFSHGASQSVLSYGVTTGRWLDIRQGSAGTPDTGFVPPVKISRYWSHTYADGPTGDGAEQLAGFSVNTVADSTSQLQAVGIYAAAQNSGTTKGAADSPDAAAIYALSKISGASAIGVAIPGYFVARKEAGATSATITALQIANGNFSGTPTSYSASGFQDSGIYLAAYGDTTNGTTKANSQSAAGLLFDNPFGIQLDVGIGVTSRNGIKTATFRDDGNAATSIVINGSHTTGIDMHGATLTGFPLLIPNNKYIAGRNNAGTGNVNMWLVNPSDQLVTSTFVNMTGGAAFSGTPVNITDVNVVLGTVTGTKIGTSTSQLLGFWNATPVAQIAGSTDVLAGLVTVGLRAASANPPLNLGSGALTAGASTLGATTVTTLGTAGQVTLADGNNIAVGSTNGTQIATLASQKIALWGKAPIAQPTVAIAGASRTAGGGATLTATDTFGTSGYTIPQLFQAAINFGLLA